jgi:hypothetical protein
VGIAARGAVSSVPDAPGELEADTSSKKNAFAESAHATGAQKTFSSACARNGRSLDDGLNNGLVSHHWYGSDIGGWESARLRLSGSEVAGRMREAA